MCEPNDYNRKTDVCPRHYLLEPQAGRYLILGWIACAVASVFSLTIAQAVTVAEPSLPLGFNTRYEVQALAVDSVRNLYILVRTTPWVGINSTLFVKPIDGEVTPLVTESNLTSVAIDELDNIYVYNRTTQLINEFKGGALMPWANLSTKVSYGHAFWSDGPGLNLLDTPNTNNSVIYLMPFTNPQPVVRATFNGISARGAASAGPYGLILWDCYNLYSSDYVTARIIASAADIISASVIPFIQNDTAFSFKVVYSSRTGGIGAINLFPTNTPPPTNITYFAPFLASSPDVYTLEKKPRGRGNSFLTYQPLGSTDSLSKISFKRYNVSLPVGIAGIRDPFSGVAYLLPFQISKPPAYLTAYAGLNASLSVSAFSDDGSQLFYQWSQNGVPIPGATNATLTISNAQPADAGVYLTRVSLVPGDTNADTVVSDGGLSVLPPYTFSGVTNGFYGGAVAGDNAGVPGVFLAVTAFGVIEFLDTNGVATVIAGSLGGYGLADGVGSNAAFATPQGLAIDSQNNLFVADTGNNALREVSPTGNSWTTTTIAGGQTNAAGMRIQGWADGVGTNALFSHPYCVAVDGLGNVYAGDYDSNVVRKLTWTGSNWLVTTLAGIPGRAGWADGPGTNAIFNGIFGLAADTAGDVFVADRFNYVIREIDTNGTVTTIAGLRGNSGNTDGVGINARFGSPDTVTWRCDGTLLVGDAGYGTIRQLIPEGTNWLATTLSSGLFVQPRAVAAACSGMIYVSDPGLSAKGSNSVLFGYPGSTAPSIIAQPQPQTQIAGARATLSVTISNASPVTYQWLFNGVALAGQTNATLSLSGLARSNEGVYQVVVIGPNGAVVSDATLLRVLVPPLLEPPFIRGTNGTVHILFADADGGLPDDLDSLEVQWRSTLPSGTDTNWQTLIDSPSLFNGYVRVQDTNGLAPFKIYRVVKH